MTVDVTKVACAYIEEATKFIDGLRYGINCHNENKLFRLEQDLFMSQEDCDVDWCYAWQVDPPECSRDINCVITLTTESSTDSCASMGLITL